eukprot:UN12926
MRSRPMHDASVLINESPNQFSEAEWKSRIDCAAGRHLLEHYQLTDMVEGVLAVRVSDDAQAYLLKTYKTFLMRCGLPNW